MPTAKKPAKAKPREPKLQLTTRLTAQEYGAFERWRMANGQMTESSALQELIDRFFSGGYRREPKRRLRMLKEEIYELFPSAKASKKV